MNVRTSQKPTSRKRSSWAAIALPLLAASVSLVSSHAASGKGVKCEASVVRQGSGYLDQIPVVKSQPDGKFLGVLFYARLFGLRAGDRARIKTPSASADENAKILWQGPTGKTLRVSGRRLDGVRTFTLTFPATTAAGGGALKGTRSEFPSIINLPTTGCWRLDLRVGNTREYVVIEGRK